jgi:hypothetical protein
VNEAFVSKSHPRHDRRTIAIYVYIMPQSPVAFIVIKACLSTNIRETLLQRKKAKGYGGNEVANMNESPPHEHKEGGQKTNRAHPDHIINFV